MPTIKETFEQYARDNPKVTKAESTKKFEDQFGVKVADVYGDTDYDLLLDLHEAGALTKVVSTWKANRDTPIGTDTLKAAKDLREDVADDLTHGLEIAGLTDLAISDKDQMRREEDKARGVARVAPPIPPPAIVPDAGMGMAGNFDPDKAARDRANPAGEAKFSRKKLPIPNPIAATAGMIRGAFDTSVSGIDKATVEASRETEKRKKMDWQDAFQVDAAENLASPFLLLTQLAGLRYIDPDKETVFSASRESGKQLAEGVAASTMNALDDIREGDVSAFAARPLSTATLLVPALRGAGRALPVGVRTAAGKVAGAAGRGAGAAAEFTHKVLTKPIPMTPAVHKAITGVIDSSLGALLTAEGRASVVRTITDGLHQADPRATALMQHIVQDPQNAAASIKADFERLQRRAEKIKDKPKVTPEMADAAQDIVIPPPAAAVADAAKIVGDVTDNAGMVNSPIPFTRTDGTVVQFLPEALDRNVAALTRVITDPRSSAVDVRDARAALATMESELAKRSSMPEGIKPADLGPGDDPVMVGGRTYQAEEVAGAIEALEARVAAGRDASFRDLGAERELAELKSAADEAGRWKAAQAALATVNVAEDAAGPAATAAHTRLRELGVDLPADARTGAQGKLTTLDAVPETSSVAAKPDAGITAPSVEGSLPIGVWRGRLREVAGDIVEDIRKQVEELDPDLVNRLKESGRTIDDEILTAAAGAMAGEVHSFLRNKPFRDKVAAKIAETMGVENKTQFAKQLSSAIDDAVGKSFAGDAPLGAVLFEDAAAQAHFDYALDSVMGATKSKDLIRGAVATVSENLGRELEKTALTRGIAAEAARAEGGAATILKQVQDGDLPSQILPNSMDPKQLAADMVDMAPGNAKVAAVAAVIAGYEKLDGKLLGVEGWAKPSIKASLETHVRARDAFFQDDIMSNIIRAQKLGYVPRNFKSILNNYASNEALQWWSWANPVAPGVRLGRAIKYKWFLDGKLTGPDVQMMKSISKTGIVETNRLAADIGAVVGMADISATIPGVKQMNKVLERGFALGDQIFKIDEMITNYRSLDKKLKMLKKGNYLEVDHGSQKIRFERGADGYLTYTDATAPKRQAPKNIGGEALSDLMARITTTAADRKFINYGRTAGLLQKLKSGPFRGLGSGFATWMAGAIDVPVAKKGLLHASIAEPLGMVTNDPGILRALAHQDAAVAMRRAIMLGIAGDKQTGSDAQDVGKGFNWSANEARPMITLMIDPDTAASADLRGVDYLGPTKLLTRAAVSMGLAFKNSLRPEGGGTPEALLSRVAEEGADPMKWSKYTQLMYRDATGQVATLSDGLELVAMAGSTLKDVYDKIKDTEQANKVLTVADAMSIAMTPFLGATAADLLTGGAAAGVEFGGVGTISKNRARTMGNDPTDMQSFLRWYIRHMTGKGFDERLVSDARPGKSYSPYSKYQRKWLASLGVKDLWDDGLAMIKLGDAQNKAEPGSGKVAKWRGEQMLTKSETLKAAVKEVIYEKYNLSAKRAKALGRPVLPMPTDHELEVMEAEEAGTRPPEAPEPEQPLFVEPEPESTVDDE